MKSGLILFVLLGWLAALSPATTQDQPAPTNSPASPATGPQSFEKQYSPGLTSRSQRLVFVVDTSFSMARLEAPLRQTIFDLVSSGAQGYMRPGDIYEIWTFNEQVYKSRFPPMAWDPLLDRALANGAVKFLKSQRFEKQTRLDKLWSELSQAAENTDDLMVLLLSDGDESLRGSPFDNRINAIYTQRFSELRRARKPFVTVLTARGGEFVAFTVAAAGERIDFDVLAQQIIQSSRPSLVRTMPAPAISPIPSLVATNTALAHPLAVKPPPAPQIESIPPPVLAANNPTASQTVSPASSVSAKSEMTSPKTTSQPPLVAADTNTFHPPASPSELRQEGPSLAARIPQTSVPKPSMDSEGVRLPPPNASSQGQASAPPDAAPQAARPAESGPPLQSQSPPLPKEPELAVSRAVSSPEAALRQTAVAVPPQQTAVVVPPQNFMTSRGAQFIAGVLLLLATGLAIWYLYSGRASRRSSFISQSLDREIK
jgi:hypothetical protein